jgi:hypothetical protein
MAITLHRPLSPRYPLVYLALPTLVVIGQLHLNALQHSENIRFFLTTHVIVRLLQSAQQCFSAQPIVG